MSKLPPTDDPSGPRSRRASSHSSPNDSEDAGNPQQKLHLLLAGIWERSKETVVERIEILCEANRLAAGNMLDEAARLRAIDSAHKLAGVLGTFGLPRGTELAREAEEAFGRTGALSRAETERLGGLLKELEILVGSAEATMRGAK